MKKLYLKKLIKESVVLSERGGGQSPGKLEVVSTDVSTARNYAKSLGINLQTDLPNFSFNYRVAQKLASLGKTKRRDMPVITSSDLKQFQQRLSKGHIDIHKPFAPSTDPSDPFPDGLSGTEAEEFLKRGHKDGDKTDDTVDMGTKKVAVKYLKPIQQQIYFDKSIKTIADNGIKGSTQFLQRTFFIASADNYIIDGHHRFLSALLLDPNMKVNVLAINLPIKQLLPLTIAYSDAIGNKRNA